CPAGAPTNPNECGLAGQTNGICAATSCFRTTNPGTAQRVRYYQYSVTQRDYDYDGVENALDTCADVPNVGWDPRQSNALSGGDTEGDGLPNACDPQPAVFNNDQDSDLWGNRLDNFLLVTNAVVAGGGGSAETNPPYVFGGAGSPPTWTAGANTNLSAAAGAGATSLTVASSAGFIQGNPIVIANPAETLRYIASVPDATHLTITSGLSSAHASGASSTVRMVSYAQSLRDMTNDGFVDISDVQKLTGVFGARGGDPTAAAGYQGRYDTNYDNFVDISDVQSLTGMFGATCGP